ncbi:hypothetical protein HC031_03990 [Planosporangium thailandense]|uniref:Uncharacterized protein n=1 Tax=Planosporangium thailandense TaxID=765197 RepID=A0ABX0XTX7_9ACTN|nr:hypothetical protein [Planosporangium thailandense]NJC68890.1 hypothetical protein [Planosporangium thailandense]
MADAAAPVEPERRPAVVTAACWMLYLAAAGQLLLAIIMFSHLGATRQAYTKVLADTPVKGATDVSVAIIAANAAVNLVFAIGYVVVAILDGRGRNPARIVTWVIAGLAICMSCCGLASTAIALSGLGDNGANGAPSAQDIQRALRAALPGWYEPVITTIQVVSLAALVVAVVLLALPAANQFFRRKPAAGWEPPVPATPPVPPPTA